MQVLDLGDGLILRTATPADVEALAEFNQTIFAHDGRPNMPIGQWIRDLFKGDHPTISPSDFTIVQDSYSGAIVSSLCLIDQVWTYEGIPFGVGRPELVATHPDYRRRGLIRKQFEVIHGWSAERGQKLQAITGIRYYYRQFGYEMALPLGGSRFGARHIVPKLKADETEPFTFRPATEADIPLLMRLYHQFSSRYPIATVVDEAYWHYILNGRHPLNITHWQMRIVESKGEAIGALGHSNMFWDRRNINLTFYELLPGQPWYAVTPSALRYLDGEGQRLAARDHKEFIGFSFGPGSEHPLFNLIGDELIVGPPYAWYIRIADLADFIQHIAPALETRIENSVMVGYSGDLSLSFYNDSLRISFEHGKITKTERFRPQVGVSYTAEFPDLTFLQLVMGRMSFEELRQTFVDVNATAAAKPLIEALFPKKWSTVWGVD